MLRNVYSRTANSGMKQVSLDATPSKRGLPRKSASGLAMTLTFDL